MTGFGGSHKGHLLLLHAIASSASRTAAGNFLPCFAARRRIPAHARGLKKYLRGASTSNISDNEHTTAPLWNSGVLAVQHPPCHAIPEFNQPVKDDGKVPASVAAEKSGYIFNDNPCRAQFAENSCKLEPQAGPFSSKARPSSGNGQVLAGEAPANKINRFEVFGPDFRDILMAFHPRKVAREYQSGELVDFALPGDFGSDPRKDKIESAHPRK